MVLKLSKQQHFLHASPLFFSVLFNKTDSVPNKNGSFVKAGSISYHSEENTLKGLLQVALIFSPSVGLMADTKASLSGRKSMSPEKPEILSRLSVPLLNTDSFLLDMSRIDEEL